MTYLPVEKNGIVNLEKLEAALREDTAICSVMAVNNEIGVIQPLKEIGAICKKKGVFFHTDAAQAVGKIPINVEQMNIDLMSISGHKIYGPKGIGALYVSKRRPRVRLEPLMSGGGQERGLRSGTVPTSLAVGLGAACKIATYVHHNLLESNFAAKKCLETPSTLRDCLKGCTMESKSEFLRSMSMVT